MGNVTAEISMAVHFFRRYLLGESLKNSFIRFTVILSAIILVWGGIILALIIHMKCQRARQISKSSNTHHAYENEISSSKKQPKNCKRNRRFDSSSSLSSTRCYSIRRILSQLKRHCIFWPSSSSTNFNGNSVKSSLLSSEPNERVSVNPYPTSNKIQIMVESMAKRSLSPDQNRSNNRQKFSSCHETDSSSADESRNHLYSSEDDQQCPIDINRKSSNIVQLMEPERDVHHLSLTMLNSENQDDYQTTERLHKLHEFNTKATLFFHPITRRLSNTNTSSCLPSINTIQQQQQQRKSLLVVSSARELTTENKWKWKHSLINDPIVRDENTLLSSRQLPLVMITDTSSSNTNIVELETYEDNHRLMSDLEKHLSRQLRASYQPRHST